MLVDCLVPVSVLLGENTSAVRFTSVLSTPRTRCIRVCCWKGTLTVSKAEGALCSRLTSENSCESWRRRCCGGKKRENRGKKRGIDEITEEIEGNRRKSRARDCGKVREHRR